MPARFCHSETQEDRSCHPHGCVEQEEGDPTWEAWEEQRRWRIRGCPKESALLKK